MLGSHIISKSNVDFEMERHSVIYFTMVAEMLQKHIFIFNIFLSKKLYIYIYIYIYIYLHSIKKIMFCKNFVVQGRSFIKGQTSGTSSDNE